MPATKNRASQNKPFRTQTNPYCVYRYPRKEREMEAAHPNTFKTLWCYIVGGKPHWASGPLAAPLALSYYPTIAVFIDHENLWHVEALVNLDAPRAEGITDDKIVDGTLRLPLSAEDESETVRFIAASPLRLGKWATDRLGPALEAFLASKGARPASL